MSDPAAALNPEQRERDLERLASTNLEILVVGGGVTGVGTALDAASRGMTVGLLEQRDYASGTSSRSSKLFHGGLRYLEQLNFGLVSEALHERNLMLKTICPHLTKPVSFLYPLRHRFWERFYVGAGVLFYDWMARATGSPLPKHSHLSKSAMEIMAPSLRSDRFHGAVRYWDALFDDARHTLTVARTAAAHGAVMAPSTRVVGLEKVAAGYRVSATDLESGERLEIDARTVVNASGVWNDDIQDLAGSDPFDMSPSKGVHIVVPATAMQLASGVIIKTEHSILLILPWGDHWIVGTTDTPWSLGRAHPAASKRDIDYLLSEVNKLLRDPIGVSDVVGVYAGLRPLLGGETEQTSRLSREHVVAADGTGLISVAGGKYTTYRVMAKDVVDMAAEHLTGQFRASQTDRLALLGADTFRWSRREPYPRSIAAGTHERLLGRYGSLTSDLYDLIETRPELARQTVDDSPYLLAEFEYAATHEGALHLDDFLTRRTRMSIETRHRGIEATQRVSDLVAPLLGWESRAREREIEHYHARVEAELDSQSKPDDKTADAARVGAPDVRTGKSE